MQKSSLRDFLSNKLLAIPSYQRDYAWVGANVQELWADIQEALDLSCEHYLGTFVLARGTNADRYDLVDGQQRLTTLTMLLWLLVRRIPDERERWMFEDRLLLERGHSRLVLSPDNDRFFRSLVSGEHPPPETGGQKRLATAYTQLADNVAGLAPADIRRWVEGVSNLEVLEFVETDAARAIRIFETVNDRGKPLSVMEKLKSHLVLASNRYLRGALDTDIQGCFGGVFRAYDALRELAGEDHLNITLLKSKRFNEDSVLRYHAVASTSPYTSPYWDWSITAEGVLVHQVKPAVKALANQPEALQTYIAHYVADLTAYFGALSTLVASAKHDPKLFNALTNLELSATLYPLLARLAVRGLLHEQVTAGKSLTFLDALEITDVRVYKTRGTNPEKHISALARDALTAPPSAIAQTLRWFVSTFASDNDFRRWLEGSVYGVNEATRHILSEYDAAVCRRAELPTPETVAALAERRVQAPTIDHILAQQPTISLEGRGFADEDAFEAQVHRLGNLTMVERSINSSASNCSPEEKSSPGKHYAKSGYGSTRRLGIVIANRKEPFGAEAIALRTKEIVDFALARWAIW